MYVCSTCVLVRVDRRSPVLLELRDALTEDHTWIDFLSQRFIHKIDITIVTLSY